MQKFIQVLLSLGLVFFGLGPKRAFAENRSSSSLSSVTASSTSSVSSTTSSVRSSFGALSSSVDHPPFLPLIRGGEEVLAQDPIARSTVMLETDMQYCSGVIVAPDRILTAAHCVPSSKKQWMTIHFKGLEGGVDREVESYEAHPQYQDLNETTRNDLALVFFKGGLPAGFESVSFLDENAELNLGESFELAGFGEGGPLGQLMKIQLQLTQFNSGARLLFFAQTKNHGICHGDSGGPVYKTRGGRLFLVGVASYTQEYNCSGFSAYTWVAPFQEWILGSHTTPKSP